MVKAYSRSARFPSLWKKVRGGHEGKARQGPIGAEPDPWLVSYLKDSLKAPAWTLGTGSWKKG